MGKNSVAKKRAKRTRISPPYVPNADVRPPFSLGELADSLLNLGYTAEQIQQVAKLICTRSAERKSATEVQIAPHTKSAIQLRRSATVQEFAIILLSHGVDVQTIQRAASCLQRWQKLSNEPLKDPTRSIAPWTVQQGSNAFDLAKGLEAQGMNCQLMQKIASAASKMSPSPRVTLSPSRKRREAIKIEKTAANAEQPNLKSELEEKYTMLDESRLPRWT